MDQMADEITPRADVKDKDRVNTAEESTAWVRGERIQTETRVNARSPSKTTEEMPGETKSECDPSSSSLLSLKMYLRKSSSTEASTEGSLSSSQQSNTGDALTAAYENQNDCLSQHKCTTADSEWRRNAFTKTFEAQVKVFPAVFVDCAGIVLSCLFCRFYDMMLMLPDSCERVANHCCPSYKQVITTAESTPSSDDDFWTDLDCGLLTSCHDANDCLELAMEVSEICYH